MVNMNHVVLAGRLVRDPELRYIPSGRPVCNFSVASSRVYTTQAGEKKEDTCFARIVVWGKQAESCAEYLNKGSSVLLEGRLQSRSWETEDGQKRSVMEVVANRVQFVDRKGSERAEPAPGGDMGPGDAPHDIGGSEEVG